MQKTDVSRDQLVERSRW